MSMGHPLTRQDEQQQLQELLDMTADELSYETLPNWRHGARLVQFFDSFASPEGYEAVLPDDIPPQERARRVERMGGQLP